MNYTDNVQIQLNRLVDFADAIGLHLVVSNQGFSVKVLAPSKKYSVTFESLVSAHNNGYVWWKEWLATYIKDRPWVKDIVNQHKSREAVTIQRYKGILKTQECSVSEIQKVLENRKEFLKREWFHTFKSPSVTTDYS